MRTRQLCLVLTALSVASAGESRASEPASAMDTSGWLGVEILNVTPQAARALRLEQPQGVMVLQITPGTAAEHAGLERGDVILSFNGEAIDEPGELPRLIAQQENGTEVMLKIWRGGHAHTINAPFGPRPSTSSQGGTVVGEAPRSPDGRTKANGEALGLRIRALEPAEAQPIGVEFGLIVERIDDPAQAPQLAPGDVIVGVNNERVASVQEFNAAIAKYGPGSSVALRVRRGLAVQYVAVKVRH